MFQNGDLILFKGNGFFSKLITTLPGSDYSHIGIYVDYDDYQCVFESTSLGTLPDIRLNHPINGVQLTKFADRIASYDGEVFHRQIIGPRSMEQKYKLQAFINEHHSKPYEKSTRELINAELDLPLPWELNKEDDSSLFCSETVAMALREIGMMHETDKPDNEFTPSDFSRDINLCDGYSFSEIIQF